METRLFSEINGADNISDLNILYKEYTRQPKQNTEDYLIRLGFDKKYIQLYLHSKSRPDLSIYQVDGRHGFITVDIDKENIRMNINNSLYTNSINNTLQFSYVDMPDDIKTLFDKQVIDALGDNIRRVYASLPPVAYCLTN